MRTRANKAGAVNIRWKDETFECALSRDVEPFAFSRPFGTYSPCRINPALKRRASCNRAFGTFVRRVRRNRAFTLIELLIVIGIISILAALILPGLSVVTKHTKINIARAEMARIQSAIVAYETAYGRLPMPSTAISGDFTFGPSGSGSTAGSYTANNSELMAILMDLDQLANAKHALNPRNLSLFSATRANSTNAAGLGPDLVLRDPWGNPYIITIDYDYNNRCLDAVYGNAPVSANPSDLSTGYKGLFRTPGGTTYELAAPVMIWSMGPDGNASKSVPAISGVNADNVLNWSK